MARAIKLKMPPVERKEWPQPLRIDIGCGPNKKDGHVGVDQYGFPNVDVVMRLCESNPLPFDDNSVESVHCSHFIEHLEAYARVWLVNELYRVLKPGGEAQIIAPHWAASRAYGDPTHVWPPVSEFWFYYLKRDWRLQNAPHTDISFSPRGFACDFEATWGYSIHPAIALKNAEYQADAIQFSKEAAQDIIATLKKK